MVTQAKIDTLKILKKASRDNEAPIWAKVADYVQKSRSNQKIINLRE
jgi:Ribosomal protein L18E